MRIHGLTRHAGVSFNGGPGFAHLRASNADVDVVRTAWERIVVQQGLGGALEVDDLGGGQVHGWAPLFPFVNLATLTAALRAECAGRPIARAIVDELALAGSDARAYAASYGMHVREAARRGWVVQPLRVGFYPSILLGAGRHARLLIMNVAQHASSSIALAGMNKAMARDLLAAHGLPVAPGGLVGSPDAALRVARRLGGPVVLKRLIGGNSDGVIVGLSGARDVKSAARILLAASHGILVERVITGTELRLHFVSGKLHRTYLAAPFTITGDGERTLGDLIAEKHPRYLTIMSSSRVHQRRLVMCLWGLGVRALADIHRVVPAHGREVRVSAATGAGMQRVAATEFLHSEDIDRLERFLKQHGSPSCGVDVIVSAVRAPLGEGGAILEINVPCGFGYLDDPDAAVAADLDAAIAGDSTFRRERGRVPVWLVVPSGDGTLARRAEAALREQYAKVMVGALDPERSNWISLLNQSDADALVVHVTEEAILAHGIPVNLAPMLLHTGNRSELVQNFPITCATVKHAKGRLKLCAM